MNPHTYLAAILAAIVGCGSKGGNFIQPEQPSKIWETGAYTVEIKGHQIPIFVDGDSVNFAGHDIQTQWAFHGEWRLSGEFSDANGKGSIELYTGNRIVVFYLQFAFGGTATLITGVN